MKLDKQTLDVLKNLSGINENFYCAGGSLLATKNVTNNMMAAIQVPDELPEFGIYNLNNFLGAISLFNSPELTFQEDHVVISEGRSKVKYKFADKEILDYPKKNPKFQDGDITFSLSKENMKALIKAAGVLSASRLVVRGDGTIAAKEPNTTDNEFSVDIDGLEGNFEVVFEMQFIKKMIETDYLVSISSGSMVCKWENSEQNISYFIGADKSSRFN